MESCWLGGGGGEGEGTRMWGWVKKKIKGGGRCLCFSSLLNSMSAKTKLCGVHTSENPIDKINAYREEPTVVYV